MTFDGLKAMTKMRIKRTISNGTMIAIPMAFFLPIDYIVSTNE